MTFNYFLWRRHFCSQLPKCWHQWDWPRRSVQHWPCVCSVAPCCILVEHYKKRVSEQKTPPRPQSQCLIHVVGFSGSQLKPYICMWGQNLRATADQKNRFKTLPGKWYKRESKTNQTSSAGYLSLCGVNAEQSPNRQVPVWTGRLEDCKGSSLNNKCLTETTGNARAH